MSKEEPKKYEVQTAEEVIRLSAQHCIMHPQGTLEFITDNRAIAYFKEWRSVKELNMEDR